MNGSIPAEAFDKIIPITERDGAVWDRCVCVTSKASELFVSPPCSVDSHGSVNIESWDQKLHASRQMLLIHPARLSFICRHNSMTPKKLWGSFYGEGCHYKLLRDDLMNGLLHCVDYGEMKKRTGQAFEYDLWDTEGEQVLSLEGTKQLQWLLARPIYLPTPPALQFLTIEGPALQAGTKVFLGFVRYLTILDHVVDVPINDIESELKASYKVFEPPSAIITAQPFLSLG
ncbi:hypothetical protein FGADI_1869 [Fusarium gaditjirri]|uniref:Uncharacterized protein n=1 Tax=Fusarium gaditjirri TaxID=282569 RepID=A0A8H4TJR8_9HYPO|nr:hypothetical protein FGADI_1869 [Fusarium gaditjirri]